MQKFTVHKGLVAPMDRENVDTDAIIPKQFLKSIKRSGFGPNLFDEWRYLDKGEPDEKILAVPSDDPYHNDIYDIADMPAHYLKEIEHFFGIYKDLEGKRVEIQGWEKSEVAFKVIQRSIERYAEVYLKGA